MAGITPTGFQIKTYQDLLDSAVAKLSARWGTTVSLTDDSVIGMYLRTTIAEIAEAWEVLQAVYNSQNPDAATGDALRSLRLLTGTLPLAATPSVATLHLAGTAGTVIATNSQAQTAGGLTFGTVASVTLASVPARAASTAYTGTNVVRTNFGNVYYMKTAGTTSGAGGPSGTGNSITDGSVVWAYLGSGDAYANVTANATETGPLPAYANEISIIKTPVSGWTGVNNFTDATLGTDAEQDESFRVRGEAELSGAGSHTKEAVEADILRQFRNLVTSVDVLQNKADETIDGMPPHSVECLIRGGDGQELANYIGGRIVGLGYATHGNQSYSVVDSKGITEIVKFSRPVERNIYVSVAVTKSAIDYPADGDDQIKKAIVAWGDAQRTGRDAVSSAIAAQAFSVAGVLDVTACLISLSPSPTLSTTIAIATRELAVYDTSRITVIVTNGTP